mmetsp:Transcript_48794/g.156039  ORF Transcript_48794/g.156039 Transcript_48794/m.156039 type:complete len:232 (-) Transcript_48794:822-1517(-)
MHEGLHLLGRQHAAHKAKERRTEHEDVLGEGRQPPRSKEAPSHAHQVCWEQSLLVRPIVRSWARRCRLGLCRRRSLGVVVDRCRGEEAGDADGGEQRGGEATEEEHSEAHADTQAELVLHKRQLYQRWCEEQRRPLHQEGLARLQRAVHHRGRLRAGQLPDKKQRAKDGKHADDRLDAEKLLLCGHCDEESHTRKAHCNRWGLQNCLEHLVDAEPAARDAKAPFNTNEAQG